MRPWLEIISPYLDFRQMRVSIEIDRHRTSLLKLTMSDDGDRSTVDLFSIGFQWNPRESYIHNRNRWIQVSIAIHSEMPPHKTHVKLPFLHSLNCVLVSIERLKVSRALAMWMIGRKQADGEKRSLISPFAIEWDFGVFRCLCNRCCHGKFFPGVISTICWHPILPIFYAISAMHVIVGILGAATKDWQRCSPRAILPQDTIKQGLSISRSDRVNCKMHRLRTWSTTRGHLLSDESALFSSSSFYFLGKISVLPSTISFHGRTMQYIIVSIYS